MKLFEKLNRRKCRRKGHDWFPNEDEREFLPTRDQCNRKGCDAVRWKKPWGTCLGAGDLGAHPMADHCYYIADDTTLMYMGPILKCPYPW